MITLYYKMLNEYYIPVIKYACQTCDAFGLLFSYRQDKKDKKIEIIEDMYTTLRPFLINQMFDRTPWEGCSENSVFNMYRCTPDTAKILLDVKKIANWWTVPRHKDEQDLPWANMDMPEDLSFFRKNKVWLRTVMHEEIAYISNDTKEDVEFFKQLGIRAHYSNNSGDVFPVNYNLYRIIK